MWTLQRIHRVGCVLVGFLAWSCAGTKEDSNLLTLFSTDPALTETSDLDLENTYDALTLLKWAEAHYVKADYAAADLEYRRFLALHPTHEMAPFARHRLAMSRYQQIGAPDRDPTPMNEALAAFEATIADDPEGPDAASAREKIKTLALRRAQHAFDIGLFYYHKAAYPAAIARFSKAVSEGSDAALIARSYYFLGQSYHKAGYPTEAAEMFGRLQTEYPDSAEAEKRRGEAAGQ